MTIMALRKRQPTEEERRAFLELLSQGINPAVAARQVGPATESEPELTASRFRDAQDPEFQQMYRAARAAGLEWRAENADQKADEWIERDDCPPVIKAMWLKRWQREFSDRYQLSVTQGLAGEDVIAAPPMIPVDNLTDAEMEELERCVARVHELAALARERTARPAGDLPPSAPA